jgi:acyl transferase domain-containing protein/acyl carrier protein
VISKIRYAISELLEINIKNISDDIPLSDLGVDSIIAIDVVAKINKDLSITIEAIDLFSYPTINDLSNYIAEKYTVFINIDNECIQEKSSHDEEQSISQNFIKPVSKIDDNDIAIIGIAVKFSGADNKDKFWTNICDGITSITEIPISRWNINDYYHSDVNEPGKTYCKYGGFLSDIDAFDPLFFNISPSEAMLMDPQQKQFMQQAYYAIEDANYTLDKICKTSCGIFIGAKESNYDQSSLMTISGPNVSALTSDDTAILAARMSYFLDLRGPSISVNSACSSSLVAIHMACESIRRGESVIALAGGVSLLRSYHPYILMSKALVLSHSNQVKVFDEKSDGFIPGEGVVVLLLKKLREAVNDNDKIYAVIKSSAVNQDGKTNGIMAPSAESQTRVEIEAYQKAGINAADITYIETHGTGTKLGDPIEIKGLQKAFAYFTEEKHFCALGSLKPNIGHTMLTSGAASLVKVALALKYKIYPPLINFEQLNSHISLEDSPFYITTSTQHWQHSSKPRIAGVSSFGMSGTNCHMVLQEFS